MQERNNSRTNNDEKGVKHNYIVVKKKEDHWMQSRLKVYRRNNNLIKI